MIAASVLTAAQSTTVQTRFALTFTRPLRLTPAQPSHEIFATISDGQQTFHVLEWPTKLPSFGQNSVVSLRAFSARDAVSFQRGSADLLAVCHVPLVKIAELVASAPQPVTLQLALDPSSSGEGEINLHNHGLLIERFERSRQAASVSPLQPKVCVIVEQTTKAAAPTVSRFSSAPAVPSPEKATTDRAPMRFYSVNSTIPVQVEDGGALAARMPTTTSVPMKTSVQSPAATTPDLVRTLSPMVTPFSPQEFASPRSNSDEKSWLVTWETRWAEENARITKSAREFEKAFRFEQAREKRKLIAFEHGISIFEEQRMRWQVHEHFRAWQRWLANEKAGCQFHQLAGEHEQLKQIHHAEETDATQRLAMETSTLERKVAEINARRSREAAGSEVLHQMWACLVHSGLLATSLLVWHQFTTRSKFHRYGIEEAWSISVIELLFLVLRSWFNHLAALKRAAALDVTSNTWRGLPRELQEKTKSRVYGVLHWSLHAWEILELNEWCSHLLWAWHEVLGMETRYCNVAEIMLGLSHGDFFYEALLRRAWSAWLCERDACRTAASISLDMEQTAAKMLSARKHAVWIMDASSLSGDFADMSSAMLCWKYFITIHRMECALEQISIEQQIVRDEADIFAVKLDSSRNEVSRSQTSWNEERAAMRKSLSIVQTELVESRDFTAQMLSERSRLSHLLQASSDQERICAGELAASRGDLNYASEQLHGKLDSFLKVRQKAEKLGSECEAVEQELLAKQEQLKAVITKHADKRSLDIRELKAQAKGEISKYEELAEDLRESRYADQQLWTSKFRQAETRRTQLEKELQSAQRGVTMATPRSAGYEVERQQLQRRLAVAESRLARTETASSCEAELHLLHGEFEQASSRYAELSEKMQHQVTTEEAEEDQRVTQERTAHDRAARAPHTASSSVPSSPLQRVHERGPMSPPRANAPRSPASPSASATDEQRDQDLRAMLDDFQRAVRAPRSPLSPVALSHASSPETTTRKSSPSFSISNPLRPRDRNYSEDSLPSESIIQAAMSPNQNTSSDTVGNSVAQNLAQRLDEAPWLNSSASGIESPLGSEARGSASGPVAAQSRLQWLLTPPRSDTVRLARTPPRRRTSSPPLEDALQPQQDVTNESIADVEVADDIRPRPRGITAARANALWRQQTLTEHDAERRTLQQRVEQMRRQINAERAAAPKRQSRGPMVLQMQAQLQSAGSRR